MYVNYCEHITTQHFVGFHVLTSCPARVPIQSASEAKGLGESRKVMRAKYKMMLVVPRKYLDPGILQVGRIRHLLGRT